MPDSADTKIIISLLEADQKQRAQRQDKADQDMAHLHDCIHRVDENLRNITGYFIGIDTQTHIVHHARMEENAETQKSIRTAIWGSVIAVVFTVSTAFMQWSTGQAQKELKAQIADLVKQSSEVDK